MTISSEDPFKRSRKAAAKAFTAAESAMDADPAASPAHAPKQVVKEGLSEYFIFTIEGREDIKDNEPKRLVSMAVADVPLECIYKLTDREQGDFFTKFSGFHSSILPWRSIRRVKRVGGLRGTRSSGTRNSSSSMNRGNR